MKKEIIKLVKMVINREKLELIRKREGLTYKQIARRSGRISSQSVANAFGGSRNMTTGTINAIAFGLRASPMEFTDYVICEFAKNTDGSLVEIQ